MKAVARAGLAGVLLAALLAGCTHTPDQGKVLATLPQEFTVSTNLGDPFQNATAWHVESGAAQVVDSMGQAVAWGIRLASSDSRWQVFLDGKTLQPVATMKDGSLRYPLSNWFEGPRTLLPLLPLAAGSAPPAEFDWMGYSMSIRQPESGVWEVSLPFKGDGFDSTLDYRFHFSGSLLPARISERNTTVFESAGTGALAVPSASGSAAPWTTPSTRFEKSPPDAGQGMPVTLTAALEAAQACSPLDYVCDQSVPAYFASHDPTVVAATLSPGVAVTPLGQVVFQYDWVIELKDFADGSGKAFTVSFPEPADAALPAHFIRNWDANSHIPPVETFPATDMNLFFPACKAAADARQARYFYSFQLPTFHLAGIRSVGGRDQVPEALYGCTVGPDVLLVVEVATGRTLYRSVS